MNQLTNVQKPTSYVYFTQILYFPRPSWYGLFADAETFATDMFLCVDACEPLEPLLVGHTCKSVDSRKSKCTKVQKWCEGIKGRKKKLTQIECSREGDLLIVLNGDNFYCRLVKVEAWDIKKKECTGKKQTKKHNPQVFFSLNKHKYCKCTYMWQHLDNAVHKRPFQDKKKKKNHNHIGLTVLQNTQASQCQLPLHCVHPNCS